MFELSSLDLTISTISFICWTIYSGTVKSFSLRIMFSENEHYAAILQAFEKMGVVLGLSLGGFIYSGLYLIYRLNTPEDIFIWPKSQMLYSLLFTFFCLWTHNIRLEIWSLEPLRKKHSESDPSSDMIHKKIRHALLVHGALTTVVSNLIIITILV